LKVRRFGHSDWQVSEIGLGGSWFYGRPEFGPKPISYGVNLVERAIELGINYFDTAPLYGKGRSEEVLGHALKGIDQPYYLATKVGYFPEPFDYTRDSVLRGFEASLKRLQVDRVDLVQIHESEQAGWDGVFGAGRTLETLRELKEQGLTTHIGLTGSDLTLMAKILDEADDFTSVITFLKYDMLVQDAADELIPSAARNDAAVICASPLHGGLLGSKRDHWRETGRFAERYERQERIEAVLSEHDITSVEAGLRYLLSDDRVGMILSGVASVEELETSVAASTAGPLPPGLIEQINSA